MANYTIGDMIFETRMARGYSQEELAFGICSTSSLSRIENNTQVPSKRIFDALMQRLGVSESIYSAFISKEEMELYRLKQKMVWKLENLDFSDMDILIYDMENRLNEWNFLDKQYLLFVKASILHHNKGADDDVLQMLLEAIHITMPGFSENGNIKSRLLTFDEITILNSIALQYDAMGKKEKALKILLDLKNYMEEHEIDEEEKAKKYPMIIYNITTRMGKMGLHQEVYRLCDDAISLCVKCNKLIALPYLLTNKAFAAAEIDKHDESKILFMQAITLYLVCNKEMHAEHLKKELWDRYGIKMYQEPSIKSSKIYPTT